MITATKEINWHEVKKFVETVINKPFVSLLLINGEVSIRYSEATVQRISFYIASVINDSITEVFNHLPSIDRKDYIFRVNAINETMKILANAAITLDKNDKYYTIRINILREAMKFNYCGE